MWLETVYQSQDHSEKCPTCGGGVQRRTHGEVYAGSSIQDGQRVEIRRTPDDKFADPIFLDPLTQYFDGGLYRLWPGDSYFARGGKRLHRDVWAAAFGPIPNGCHIHHIDGNPANNHLHNLECMDGSEHLSRPNKSSRISDAARSAAARWHGSEAGRLWHSRHAKRSKSWTKWKRVEKNCLHCGVGFLGIERKSGNSQKYCSQTCKALAYRKREKAR